MLTSTQYINANKDAVVENALIGYIRCQHDLRHSIQGSAEHAALFNICTYNEALTAYAQHLHDVLEDYKAFYSFINRCRKSTISPATGTAQHYIFIIWECDYTIQTVYQFLKQAGEV